MTTETQSAPVAERGERTILTGKVTSAKMQKTIVVEVQRLVQHPKYRRVVRISKKFYARRKSPGQARRHGAHRGLAATFEVEALAVEGSADAERVGRVRKTGERTNDSDANLADGGRQFRRAQADLHHAGGRRRGAQSRPWRRHHRRGEGSHPGKPGKKRKRSESRCGAHAERAAAQGWHVHPV